MKYFYCKLGFIQFPIISGLAMLFHNDYSFEKDFLSDLGRISNITLDLNILSWLLFTSSLIIVGISLIMFYSKNFWGILSGISFICVAFSPIDILPFFHMFFAILAFLFLTVATVKADLRILTGVLIAFFFNFLIAESIVIQVLNQKFIFYSMIILHLICLYNVSFVINRYYFKFRQTIFFSFEDNVHSSEMRFIRFVKDFLNTFLINYYQNIAI
ncbi:MAG: hypothetical protein ACFFAU_18310 [Candidatus Hodarchaeota archaeon]